MEMRRLLSPFGRRQRVRPTLKRASWLGGLAGLLSCLPRRSRSRITRADMKKHDFATSTQRLGVRFSELIRATFRFRWLNRL
jgi:hypothetical protein